MTAMYEYVPRWMTHLAARISARHDSETIAGIGVWSVTPDDIRAMTSHQRGHMRRAAKLLARDPWRDSKMRATEVLKALAEANQPACVDLPAPSVERQAGHREAGRLNQIHIAQARVRREES